MIRKLVRAVTEIKVSIMPYYLQYFTVIAHNIEQHCGFGSALSPITSGGNLPPVWEAGLAQRAYLTLLQVRAIDPLLLHISLTSQRDSLMQIRLDFSKTRLNWSKTFFS